MVGPVAVGVGIVAVAVAIDQILARVNGETSWQERAWLYAHPGKTLTIRDCTLVAFDKESSFFGDNSLNDEGDAFRHCYWSALLARDLGQDVSGFYTSLHEEQDDNPEPDKNMDLHNNGMGRWSYFPDTSDDGMARTCLKLLVDGKLIVNQSNPSKLRAARKLLGLPN